MKRLTTRQLLATRRRRFAVYAGSAILLLAALFGLIGSLKGSAANNSLSADGAIGDNPAISEDTATQKGVPDTADAGGSGSAARNGADVVSASLPLIAPGQYLVRSGQLTLTIQRGGLERAVDQIVKLTNQYGGYVLTSSVGISNPSEPTALPVDEPIMRSDDQMQIATPDDRQPYAWVTVRVPAERFDDALAHFKRLGTVREVSTNAEDVSGQVVDLEARLRHYRAVLERLLGFLDKAETVSAALAVQNRIDQTELTVEQLTAELKQLKETVAYSTISVSLSEKAPKAGAIDPSDSFWGSIKHSARLIADGARYSFVALGAALPFIALGAVVLGIVVLAWRGAHRRRGSTPPSAQLPTATPTPPSTPD